MIETLTVLAAQTPSSHGTLIAAHAGEHDHVNLDGTLRHTDRVRQADQVSTPKLGV